MNSLVERAKDELRTYQRCSMKTCEDLIAALGEASPPAPGVKVKPLEWIRKDEKWTAKTPLGTYIITLTKIGSGWYDVLLWGSDDFGNPKFTDLYAALACAQADYERRILSALDLSPAPGDPICRQCAGGEPGIPEHCTCEHASPAPVPAGMEKAEPVAWRETDGDAWVYYDRETNPDTFEHITLYQKDQHGVSIFPLYAAPPAAEAREGWRTMDSAPRDGTHFLAYELTGEMYRACYHEHGYVMSFCGQPVVEAPEPDFWLPLDALPERPASPSTEGGRDG